MNIKQLNAFALKGLALFAAITLVTACKIVIGNNGAGSGSGGSSTGGGTASSECGAVSNGVNWGALMTKNCPKLSDYNLFADSTDPTANPNQGGIPYDLATPLFTDYASKYRFVFIPQGKKAVYNENEVLEFPLGTVLVKTFAMPEDTAFRDGNEVVIETRLLILRDNGWVARPYYWDSATDASLAITGKAVPNTTTIHNGVQLDFTYEVPKATSCTSCHSVVPLLQGPNDTREAIFKPIGPKARNLNKDFDYNGIIENQLTHWESLGVLQGLPANFAGIPKVPVFNDNIDVNSLSVTELNDYAKAYLDNNCAHCHRSELTLPEPLYAGAAGGSGLQLEYNRNYADNPTKFGACKIPVAGGHPDYSADVVPQDANDSYLLFRMSTNDERHRMPELGRSTVHQEGVALIRRWINNLPAESCSPAP